MTIGTVVVPAWLALILTALAVTGLGYLSAKASDAGYWLVDRWRDRHEVDDFTEDEPGDDYADELADMPHVPEHEPDEDTATRLSPVRERVARQGPAPAADPGWQVTDTGTLFPPLWLDRRPDLVVAIPALGREWRP